MIRRPPRSTLDRSSAASDVYKRQVSILGGTPMNVTWNVASTTAAPVSCAAVNILLSTDGGYTYPITLASGVANDGAETVTTPNPNSCLLYTSPSPQDRTRSPMPSSA